jgi:putative hydrolase of the HAD superfamily
MAIKAVVFDIGGVLEINPRTGWTEKWEAQLHLKPGELNERLREVWGAGSLGKISIEQVEKSVGEILGLDAAQLAAFISDLWEEYVGELNIEMVNYFASLRPRYQTAILSNSFVGAREKEEERYRFSEICDFIIYSHEEGIVKPEKAIFELMCQRLNLQPSEIVFLDDVEITVNAARELGIQAILFRETAQAIADIEACLNR